MQRLITRFKDRAGLPAQHGWILNQVVDPNHEKKMALASDGSSLVLAYLPGGSPASITISTSALPDLTCSGSWTIKWGNGYLVVWHADALDGSLYGIFGQRLDDEGQLAGPRFRVNTFTEHDQRDPAIGSDAAGNVVVVWSSYGQDGDLGGIFGQRFDRSGNRVGTEFVVSTSAKGHQAQPQVVSDAAGNFAVAWNNEFPDESTSTISARLFSRFGEPLTGELPISLAVDLSARLVDAQMSTLGGFSLRWAVADALGVARGQYMQSFDAAGRPSGPPVKILE